MIFWAVIALSSAFFFAVKDILAKRLFKKDVTPMQLIFEQYLLVLLFILVFFYNKVNYASFLDMNLLYFAKAVSVGGATLLYLRLLKTHDISVVSPILNVSPLFLILLSFLFLNEAISLIQIGGILLIISSTYFLEVTITHHHKKEPHKYYFINLKNKDVEFFFISLIMVILISIAAITDKIILQTVDVYTNLYFTAIIIFVILLGYYVYEKRLEKVIKNLIHEPETLLISVFTIISTFLVLIAIAIPGAMVSLIVPLRRTSTLFSSLIGGILFHEKHLFEKMIATSFMLVGVVLIVL